METEQTVKLLTQQEVQKACEDWDQFQRYAAPILEAYIHMQGFPRQCIGHRQIEVSENIVWGPFVNDPDDEFEGGFTARMPLEYLWDQDPLGRIERERADIRKEKEDEIESKERKKLKELKLKYEDGVPMVPKSELDELRAELNQHKTDEEHHRKDQQEKAWNNSFDS